MDSKTRRRKGQMTSTPPQAIAVERMKPHRNGRDGRLSSASTGRSTSAAPPAAPADRAMPPDPNPPGGDAAGTAPQAVREACDRLASWTREMHALIGRIERARYDRLIARTRQVVRASVPGRAVVAVVSRGDERLVTLPGRTGWHFPQTAAGVYAGHHPADGRAAIAHLDHLRARGARYLLIPRTAFWWLDHYRDFAEHLERTATAVYRDERTCALFALKAGRKTA